VVSYIEDVDNSAKLTKAQVKQVVQSEIGDFFDSVDLKQPSGVPEPEDILDRHGDSWPDTAANGSFYVFMRCWHISNTLFASS
jgi:hypothetical protein